MYNKATFGVLSNTSGLQETDTGHPGKQRFQTNDLKRFFQGILCIFGCGGHLGIQIDHRILD